MPLTAYNGWKLAIVPIVQTFQLVLLQNNSAPPFILLASVLYYFCPNISAYVIYNNISSINNTPKMSKSFITTFSRCWYCKENGRGKRNNINSIISFRSNEVVCHMVCKEHSAYFKWKFIWLRENERRRRDKNTAAQCEVMQPAWPARPTKSLPSERAGERAQRYERAKRAKFTSHRHFF